MFTNILAAIDGSACAANALDVAIDLAKRPGVHLTILHAIDPTLGTDPLRDRGHEILAAAEQKATAAGVKVSTEMVQGSAVEEVVDIAKRLESDLVVIGSHGRKGLDRILVGSVAEGVLRGVEAPTLIVHAR